MPPNPTCQRDIFFFLRIIYHTFYTEHECFFHSQTHIVNCGLLRIRKVPFNLFIRNFLESRLFYLHFKYLTEILLFHRKRFELRGLHIQLRSGTSHPYKCRTFIDRWNTILNRSDLFPVDCINIQFSIFFFTGDIKYQIGFRFRHTVCFIPFNSLNENRLGNFENIVIRCVQFDFLRSSRNIRRGRFCISDIQCRFSRFYIYRIIVDNHRSRTASSRPTR